MNYQGLVLTYLLAAVLSGLSRGQGVVVKELPALAKFSLRPGVPGNAEVSLDGYQCRFEYTVDGGSSEEWQMEITKKGNSEYLCTVGRPTSYLYFKDFLISASKGVITSFDTQSNGAAIQAARVNERGNRVRPVKGWKGNASMFAITVDGNVNTETGKKAKGKSKGDAEL